jgi:hypothetical protein
MSSSTRFLAVMALAKLVAGAGEAAAAGTNSTASAGNATTAAAAAKAAAASAAKNAQVLNQDFYTYIFVVCVGSCVIGLEDPCRVQQVYQENGMLE